METARRLATQDKQDKFATIRDLNRIHSTWSSLEGVIDLPCYVRSWIPYLTVVLKFGFGGIKAPIAALTAAHWRANARANRSIRSTYKALAWLERHGWLSRRHLRIGENCKLVIIDLNRDKFTYFLKRADMMNEPTSIIVPHTDLHLQIVHPSELSSTTSPSLRSIDSNANLANSKPCAKSANNKNRTKHYQNPIRYTCFLLLGDSPDKKRVLRRLDAELDGKTHRNTLDWQYWITRWPTMTHQEREFCAATDIIPAMKNAIGKPKHPKITKIVEAQPDRTAHLKDFSADELADLARIQHFLAQQQENFKKN